MSWGTGGSFIEWIEGCPMVNPPQRCFAIRGVENWSQTGQAWCVENRTLLLLRDVPQAPGANTCQLQPTFRRPDQDPRNLFAMAHKLKGEKDAVHE